VHLLLGAPDRRKVRYRRRRLVDEIEGWRSAQRHHETICSRSTASTSSRSAAS
jgi:hypothetical protein